MLRILGKIDAPWKAGMFEAREPPPPPPRHDAPLKSQQYRRTADPCYRCHPARHGWWASTLKARGRRIASRGAGNRPDPRRRLLTMANSVRSCCGCREACISPALLNGGMMPRPAACCQRSQRRDDEALEGRMARRHPRGGCPLRWRRGPKDVPLLPVEEALRTHARRMSPANKAPTW